MERAGCMYGFWRSLLHVSACRRLTSILYVQVFLLLVIYRYIVVPTAREQPGIVSAVFVPFSELPRNVLSAVASSAHREPLDPFVAVSREDPTSGQPSSERPFGSLVSVLLKLPLVHLTQLEPPFQMFTLDPRSEGYGGPSFELHRRGMFEDEIVERLSMTLQSACRAKQSLFIDVGVNIGFFSLLAASWGCSVIGFEANPTLRGLVQNSADLNGFDRFMIVPHGAGPTRSKVFVNNKRTCPACSSVTTETDPDAVQIELVDISSYIHERPMFMKIDIDGYEIGALEGALAMIRKFKLPHGYVELNAHWWQRSGISHERGTRLITQLSDLGYTFSHADGSPYPVANILEDIKRAKPDQPAGDCNVFFSL